LSFVRGVDIGKQEAVARCSGDIGAVNLPLKGDFTCIGNHHRKGHNTTRLSNLLDLLTRDLRRE
jgi:hypothetical protein